MNWFNCSEDWWAWRCIVGSTCDFEKHIKIIDESVLYTIQEGFFYCRVYNTHPSCSQSGNTIVEISHLQSFRQHKSIRTAFRVSL